MPAGGGEKLSDGTIVGHGIAGRADTAEVELPSAPKRKRPRRSRRRASGRRRNRGHPPPALPSSPRRRACPRVLTVPLTKLSPGVPGRAMFAIGIPPSLLRRTVQHGRLGGLSSFRTRWCRPASTRRAMSESRMNSWRLSSDIWPVSVRNRIAWNHSSCVGRISRTRHADASRRCDLLTACQGSRDPLQDFAVRVFSLNSRGHACLPSAPASLLRRRGERCNVCSRVKLPQATSK